MNTIDELTQSVNSLVIKRGEPDASKIKNLKAEIKHFQTMANLNCCNVLLSRIHSRHGYLPSEDQITRRIRLSVKINNFMLK